MRPVPVVRRRFDFSDQLTAQGWGGVGMGIGVGRGGDRCGGGAEHSEAARSVRAGGEIRDRRCNTSCRRRFRLIRGAGYGRSRLLAASAATAPATGGPIAAHVKRRARRVVVTGRLGAGVSKRSSRSSRTVKSRRPRPPPHPTPARNGVLGTYIASSWPPGSRTTRTPSSASGTTPCRTAGRWCGSCCAAYRTNWYP